MKKILSSYLVIITILGIGITELDQYRKNPNINSSLTVQNIIEKGFKSTCDFFVQGDKEIRNMLFK